MNNAIAMHEFEKARFYSEEQRKEREALAELENKYGKTDHARPTVTRADVERVIAKWNEYPYAG